MDKEKFEKATKLLYHFGEKGFTEESIREIIPEFGKPTIYCCDDQYGLGGLTYGEFDIWINYYSEGTIPEDCKGIHINSDGLHLILDTDIVDEEVKITESLKEFVTDEID